MPATNSTASEAPRTGRARRGEVIEARIETLAYGGRGIARRDGWVVFVAGGLPGDTVRAEVTKSKKGYGEANMVELIEPSPDRIEPVCVHDGEPCPGAPWQALPYETQLGFKAEQVADALSRIGKLEGFALEEIEPAGELWRYRNKLEYSFGEDEEGLPTLGFHPRGRWDLVVDAIDCHLASEAGNAAKNEVRDWARAEGIPSYDPHTHTGVLRNLIVREGVNTGQVQTRLVTSPSNFARPPVDLHTIIEGPSGGTTGPTGVIGDEVLHERLGELRIELSHDAFFQTNTRMAERLYAVASDYAGLNGTERLFDLYCGVGTIGLSMAKEAGEVWGMEIVPQAIADAERNARINGIGNARFRAANARTGIRPLVEEAGRPDTIVIDPPRAGLSQKIVRRVIECEAKRIVYVSCNPTTLAPNAAQLVEAGYKLVRVKPVDMFPQTPHIECVAQFDKA